LYEDGVLMAAGQNKGKLFIELLSRSFSNKIKAVIFVDDKTYNIKNFRKALAEKNMTLSLFDIVEKTRMLKVSQKKLL